MEHGRAPDQVEYGELPELTRALRALGSSRQGGGTLQSQFFQPLVDARRRAADARTIPARLRAFDAAQLAQALEKAVDRIVAEWPDTRESVRRALRAEMQERSAPYVKALTLLAERAAAAVDAEESVRLERWRAWTVQLAATFVAADRTWLALRSVVEVLPKR